MANVITRKRNGKWEYRFEGAKIDGKRKQFSKSGFTIKKEALEAGNKALAKYNQTGTVIQPSEIGFSDFLDLWYESYCKNNLKPTTLTNYQKKIRLHLKPALGMYKLKSLDPTTLQQFITAKFNEGYSRNTLSVIKGILSNCLSYVVEPMKYLENNPMAYVKLPSKRVEPKIESRVSPHVYIPKEKIAEIFERFPEGSSTHIPLMFGYKCGLRLGEAFAVAWEDIDLEKRKLSVNRQVQWREKDGDTPGYWFFTRPKYDSVRVIDLDEGLVALLSRAKEKQERAKVFYAEEYIYNFEAPNHALNQEKLGEPINLVCVRESGEFIQPRTIQHTCRVIHGSMGYPEFDFHSLRHTHCSMLLEAGAAPKYVQERLGHKNLQATMNIYQHLTPKMVESGNAILNALY